MDSSTGEAGSDGAETVVRFCPYRSYVFLCSLPKIGLLVCDLVLVVFGGTRHSSSLSFEDARFEEEGLSSSFSALATTKNRITRDKISL